MKTARQKKARKNLGFFINNFKFRPPFQILIDGTFAFAALENKFNIHDQLSKYFQAEIKLLTTPCIILETEKLGSFSKAVTGAMQIVKQYPVHKCGHEKHSITGTECLRSMVGESNISRYIVATQDRELQDILRKIPCVPILYLHGKAPTLEAPSQASREHAQNIRERLGMSTWEKENIKTLKKVAGLEDKTEHKLRKKRKKGGPNPLSCLKKKKKPQTGISNNTTGTKSGRVRKRKKIKLASHVKEILVREIKNK
ncbi:rRNA-processing protein UTP23 homolog [Nomia melanderi]|uniref:rRNA-processing protein UTP23 homolog n=1 Tax=Nomia melanderi TaxID=2448451 RepID=UPI001304747E|nr:rRNA-processing protein UTP23 homolog [Nomia melanderi]XP_031827298.1 rRNA-processing protein UTP23 homolog [Nomia melanderi]XP_031827300.1 rRNA-processing protein UTP23 homolog [Nomia melanderi]